MATNVNKKAPKGKEQEVFLGVKGNAQVRSSSVPLLGSPRVEPCTPPHTHTRALHPPPPTHPPLAAHPSLTCSFWA